MCLLLSLLSILGTLPACRSRYPDARSLWEAFSERCDLPAGTLFDSEVPEADPAYLSEENFARLFARPDGSDGREEVISCVVWLGADAHVVRETAVFFCRDREGAEEMAVLCGNRLAMMRELVSYLDVSCTRDAFVRVYGKVTVFCVLPDNERAGHIFERLL